MLQMLRKQRQRQTSSALFVFCLSALALPASAEEHELVGKLWSPEQQRFIDWPEFYAELPKGGWLLIGEQHDNPDHHHFQAELISALGEQQRLGAVALEMASSDKQPKFDRLFTAGDAPTPEALDWQDGWPWHLYQAPVEAAFKWSQGVLAADINRETMSQVYRDRAPDGELEPAHADFMRDLLFESHCGQLPRSQLDPMRQVQLARDQSIARVLRNHTAADRTGILLTGSIHARKDLGVPRWLDATPSVTLILQAVEEAHSDDPSSYEPESFGNLATVDLILFTPARENPDYCAELNQ
ncbi:ChaN family lipoprotein [Marinobacterium mangrovicola]|uniref:Putative iron-regulated protein n=1 Tax=Marinobacterium mangrovicola TaxID=1476959 RepID=A0A4R1GG95_9GAMM|nr:ChaN family lipoprotein [Marinobacterium mangrovicola]TCK05920.1 putative iron-regulated protein [Marinobacterium mangrovicola]